MKLRTSILLGCAALFTATSCTTTPAKKSWSEQVIENARAQIGLEIDTIEASGKCLNPVTLNSKGGLRSGRLAQRILSRQCMVSVRTDR